MNTVITSREAILTACKELVIEKGLMALNIRDVASRCGVAVGSVYNYFPSKEDLAVATVASVWTEIMHQESGIESQASFIETVRSLFERIYQGSRKYPSFLNVHAMSFGKMDKQKGRTVMNQYFQHMEKGLLESLARDPDVNQAVFSETFSRPAYVDFVFSNMLSHVMNQQDHPDFLIEIIRRTIYR